MHPIDATDLRRVYPARRKRPARTALRGVSLRVEPASFVALLGPNGSGKSTLLRILATLDAPDSGSLLLLGHDPRTGARSVRSRLGVVFQSPALDPLLTVRENLRNHGALHGLAASRRDEAVGVAASRLGIDDRLDDRVASLSGGLVRRADLARAVLTSPALLLLDEPTTGLDPAARASFLDAIDTLRRDTGATIVLSTHLMDEATRADRVVMLSEGEVVCDGAPADLCTALGAAALRLDPRDARRLGSTGLRVMTRGREVLAAGEPHAVADAASSLARDGVSFTFSPPTLADVYLAHTGRSLSDSDRDGGDER